MTNPVEVLLVGRRTATAVTLCLALGVLGATGSDPPIVEAAKAGDWDAVRTLLEEGVDPNATAPDGATALHWASHRDERSAAELLLASGADVNAANDLGATPLWNACLNGSVSMVRALLSAGANPDAALMSGETPLMTASRTGDPTVVELLLAAGADPEGTATRGQTALMWAASQRHSDAVRVLIEHGADVHARSETWSQVMAVPPHSDPANQQLVPHGGNTALMFAARVGDIESARILLQAGAEVNDADAWGVSATMLAAHSGFSQLVELLLDQGADANAAQAGFTALHLAVMRRDADMARTLVEHGADPNVRLTNWTPTRRASRDWHFHPALIGATPLWLAARFVQPEMMRLLVEHGADPLFVHHADYVGTEGSFAAVRKREAVTTLMAAVGLGGPRGLRAFVAPDPTTLETLTLEAVKVAVESGVDVDAVDLEGRSAMDAARFDSVVDFLSGVRRE